MSSDDDFIKNILDKQDARLGKSPSGAKTKEPMSQNPKDMIRGKPAITQKEADSITDWKEVQRAEAIMKKKHGLQGNRFEEIKQEGNSLKVDENLVKERNLTDAKLIDNMNKEDKSSAKGVAHYTTGETIVLQKPEDVDNLKGNEEGKEISNKDDS